MWQTIVAGLAGTGSGLILGSLLGDIFGFHPPKSADPTKMHTAIEAACTCGYYFVTGARSLADIRIAEHETATGHVVETRYI